MHVWLPTIAHLKGRMRNYNWCCANKHNKGLFAYLIPSWMSFIQSIVDSFFLWKSLFVKYRVFLSLVLFPAKLEIILYDFCVNNSTFSIKWFFAIAYLFNSSWISLIQSFVDCLFNSKVIEETRRFSWILSLLVPAKLDIILNYFLLCII